MVDEKTRVLMIVEAGGGVRRHVVDLAANLARRRYSVYIIYANNRPDTIALSELLALAKVGVRLLPNKHLVRDPRILKDSLAIAGIFRAIRKIRPAVVHCHSSKAGLLGRIAATVLAVRCRVYTPHAYPFLSSRSRVLRHAYTLAERVLGTLFTDMTIAVSDREASIARQTRVCPARKMRVVPNGISPDLLESSANYRRSLSIPDDAVVVAAVSRLNYQKNPESFLRIALDVLSDRTDTWFVFWGDGPLRHRIEQPTRNLGVGRRILFPGFTEDVDASLAAADVYLTTSRYEGLPYSLIEALRRGLPIVATDVVGNTELVEEGRTGFLFSPSDEALAGRRLVELIEKPLLRREMGIAGRSLFMSRYTVEKMVAATSEVYADCCRRKGGAR